MKMVEEDTADDDEVDDIDWSETAYTLPEPHLITEKDFNEYVWKFSSYEEYFNFMRDPCHQSDEDSNEHSKVQPQQLNEQPRGSPNIQNESMLYVKKEPEQQKNVKTVRTDDNDPCRKEHSKICTKGLVKKSELTRYHQFLVEPKLTKITPKERRFYHAFLKNRNNICEKKENQMRMQELVVRIRTEQEEYQQFLHHSASVNMHNYMYLDEKVMNAVISNLRDSISKLLQPPQKLFKPLHVMNLDSLPAMHNPVFTFVRRVYEQGDIPKFNLPQTDVKLSNDAPVVLPKQQDSLSDDTVHAICTSAAAHVYINREALLAIMEGLVVPTREWVLSMTVKEINIGDGQKQTVLVVESPLPRRVLSTREVNKFYYEKIIKVFTKNSVLPHDNGARENGPGVPGEDLIIDIQDTDETATATETEVEEISNVHINLFTLNDLNILVETSVDQRDDESQKTFHISPKCEYQVCIGFEQFAILDLCQLWWHSKISNTDCIVCSRVDIRNDIVVRNDSYTRDILCPPECPYNPNHFCNHLYFMFKELQFLKPGKYFLETKVGDNTVNVFEEKESGSPSYEMMYKDVLMGNVIVDNTSPWLPIDTTILPDKFITNEWMSCLFSTKRPGNRKYKGNRNKKHSQSKNTEVLDFNYVYPVETTSEPPVTNRIVMSYDDEEF